MIKYPGFPNFLRGIDPTKYSDVTGILTNDVFTANLKSAANGNRHALSNLLGAYGESVVKATREAGGWTVLNNLKKINQPGYDFVMQSGSTIRLVESKARSTVRASDFTNYLTKNPATGVLKFNDSYLRDQLTKIGDLQDPVLTALHSNNLEVELFINSADYLNLGPALRNYFGGNIIEFIQNGVHAYDVKLIITVVCE